MTVPRREPCNCTRACRCESQLLTFPNVPHAFPLSLTLTGRRGASTETRALPQRACLRLRFAAVQGAGRQCTVDYCRFVEFFRSTKLSKQLKPNPDINNVTPTAWKQPVSSICSGAIMVHVDTMITKLCMESYTFHQYVLMPCLRS